MDYITQINETLTPKPKEAPLVLDLFAGCGGLALGFEAEGFPTVGFEMNADACATYRRNLHGECRQVRLTPKTEASVFNQIGNAVPPLMAFQLAKSVREYLASSERLDAKSVRRYASPVQPSLFMCH